MKEGSKQNHEQFLKEKKLSWGLYKNAELVVVLIKEFRFLTVLVYLHTEYHEEMKQERKIKAWKNNQNCIVDIDKPLSWCISFDLNTSENTQPKLDKHLWSSV